MFLLLYLLLSQLCASKEDWVWFWVYRVSLCVCMCVCVYIPEHMNKVFANDIIVMRAAEQLVSV